MVAKTNRFTEGDLVWANPSCMDLSMHHRSKDQEDTPIGVVIGFSRTGGKSGHPRVSLTDYLTRRGRSRYGYGGRNRFYQAGEVLVLHPDDILNEDEAAARGLKGAHILRELILV